MKGKLILFAAAVLMLAFAGCQTTGGAAGGDSVDALNYFNPERVPNNAVYLGDGKFRVQSTQGMSNVNSFMTFWNTHMSPAAPQFRNGYVISLTLPEDAALKVVRISSYADSTEPGNYTGAVSIGDAENFANLTEVLPAGEHILRWEGSTRVNLARIVLRIDYIAGTETGKDFEFTLNYVKATR